MIGTGIRVDVAILGVYHRVWHLRLLIHVHVHIHGRSGLLWHLVSHRLHHRVVLRPAEVGVEMLSI